VLISFPAPALCQGGDEDLLVAIGDIVYPRFVRRPSGENGLRLWVEGDSRDPQARALATDMFQTLVGALRAFRAEAGELREELLAGLGAGSVRDEAGNQRVGVGTVRVFATFGGEVEAFATNVRDAIAKGQALRNALWLNGRLGRTAPDYYMIHEYAQADLGGTKGVRDALVISANAQDRLTASANNLAPLEGGRHAKGTGAASWTLEEQRVFTADLLRRWIHNRASMPLDAAQEWSTVGRPWASQEGTSDDATNAAADPRPPEPAGGPVGRDPAALQRPSSDLYTEGR
jgi:hypothetical protein